MSFLKIILWSILIYLLFNTVKNIMKYLAPGNSPNEPAKVKKQKKSKYNIEGGDIIDAHFEEIEPDKTDKPKENS